MATYYEKYKKGFLDLFFLKMLSEEDLYGYELAESINSLSDNIISISAGNMYPILYKLEEKGFITSYERLVGKRMRRVYYSITNEGKKELSSMLDSYEKFENAASKIINYNSEDSKIVGK